MSEIKVPFSKKREPLQDILPLDAPLRVEIDPADVCNFKCEFCFQNSVNSTQYRGRLLSIDLFEIIVGQLKEFEKPIKKVYLYALGEPLLNPDITYFVKRLKETNTAETVAITTNGTKINPSIAEQLVDAGLDQLSISVNGLCDDDFIRICQTNVNFNQYLSNIKYFYDHKKQCYVHVKLEGDYFNVEEKKRFYELFDGKCDTMHIDNVADIWPDISINATENLYGLHFEGEKRVCPQPFYDMCIHTDGTVTPCDAIWDYRKYNFGNVKNISLKNIWEGKAYKQLQLSQLEGVKCDFDICNRCRFAEFGASVDLSSYRKELYSKFRNNCDVFGI